MSAWVDFVKKWASMKKVSYGCAMTDPKAKAAYAKSKEVSASKEPKAPKAPKEPKEPKPKNPLKGRATRKLYVANEDARDALARLKLDKERRSGPQIGMVGLSPTRFGFGISASQVKN